MHLTENEVTARVNQCNDIDALGLPELLRDYLPPLSIPTIN